MENKESSISVIGLLGIAFIVLKLCGVINWSWWWVTCPFWGVLALFIIILLFVYLPVKTYNTIRKRKRFEERIDRLNRNR